MIVLQLAHSLVGSLLSTGCAAPMAACRSQNSEKDASALLFVADWSSDATTALRPATLLTAADFERLARESTPLAAVRERCCVRHAEMAAWLGALLQRALQLLLVPQLLTHARTLGHTCNHLKGNVKQARGSNAIEPGKDE